GNNQRGNGNPNQTKRHHDQILGNGGQFLIPRLEYCAGQNPKQDLGAKDKGPALIERILRLGPQVRHQWLNPKRLATRFSAPPAITRDCGTLPRAGKAKVSPRHPMVPEVKSISISSPG